MAKPTENKDKHHSIRDLHYIIASYVDNNNPQIKAAKQNFEAAYKAYQRTPSNYVNSELAVASARTIIDAVLTESDIEYDHNVPDATLHQFADRLQPDQAQWVHQALNDIEEYRFWHMEREFDDETRQP